MKKSAEVIDSNNALTWPEHSPAVSADVDLGSLGQPIDFNMADYLKLLDEEEVNPVDRQKLRVNVRSFGATRGDYDPETKTINVSASHLSHPEINSLLLHETKHFIQDMEGNTYSPAEMKKRRRIGKILGAAGSAAVVGSGVGLYFVGGLEAGLMFAAPTFPFVAIGPSLGEHLGYRTHHEEREARRFAKKHINQHPNIINKNNREGNDG